MYLCSQITLFTDKIVHNSINLYINTLQVVHSINVLSSFYIN
jgi:hypothetical protein